uniref:Uncharacterized protein n=1 Tax=Rhizophora mucronata TaxID=61149 RepID=A0A2P2M0L0_RHIMU
MAPFYYLSYVLKQKALWRHSRCLGTGNVCGAHNA